jgi:hypothetical protein
MPSDPSDHVILSAAAAARIEAAVVKPLEKRQDPLAVGGADGDGDVGGGGFGGGVGMTIA